MFAATEPALLINLWKSCVLFVCSCGVKSRPFSSVPYGSLKKELKELHIKNSDVTKRSPSPDVEE